MLKQAPDTSGAIGRTEIVCQEDKPYGVEVMSMQSVFLLGAV